MLCPDCGKKMEEQVIEDQAILHCTNCGGTFFEENGINRISYNDAKLLANDKNFEQITILSEKHCPRDHSLLTPYESKETIPPDVTLLECLRCRGIFVSANDLIFFKKAIGAKIDYFKLWGIPLPSVRAVAVLSVLFFVAVGSFTAFSLWQQQNVSSIQAEDLVRNLYITSSNHYLLISFRTAVPMKSKVIFTDRTTGQTIEKEIKTEPTDYHIVTTGDLDLADELYYQLVLTDSKGNVTKTEVKKLPL
ncbi:hypothetical protein A2866_01985 [Candidatus Roizmanbacteria bacterium RIFCSPHIGHO2_01_FULL_39_8]|uniref:Uncharacterized protein n=2 Tax=Candidatus Roizmaniibacteriota TaxID=1752723 RepID=A0A1F7GIV0_9BACT|nr:MAG: hypothetical protein A2866_01985 [Candidatus Roizmanbacteria bacterium RIFCSPHIGHO2_01_FULL_39_8]OGK25676.1 MAG: hypothetical protein A3C28_01410 [Candidatus Roizmanbacteria bacterium RIFCSPHIGHO2_02_FULL_39_9]